MFTFKQAESDASSGSTAALKPEYIKVQLLDGTGNETVFES